MNQDVEKIIDRIRKLLALTRSPNEHEAAAAAAHAQRLLSEHNLAMTDVAMSEPDGGRAARVGAPSKKRVSGWYARLANGVAFGFDCQVIHSPHDDRGPVLVFVGVGADPHVAAHTFCFLERELRRLVARYIQENVSTRVKNATRNRIRNAWLRGAVMVVNHRLAQQKEQTPITPGALVRIKADAIAREMESTPTTSHRHAMPPMKQDPRLMHAYLCGQIAGKTIPFRRAIEKGEGENAHG